MERLQHETAAEGSADGVNGENTSTYHLHSTLNMSRHSLSLQYQVTQLIGLFCCSGAIHGRQWAGAARLYPQHRF